MEENKIIAYFEKQLSKEESQSIAKKLATDSSFAAKVQIIKETWILTQLVGRNKIKQQLNQQIDNDTDTVSSKGKMKVLVDTEDLFYKELKELDIKSVRGSEIKDNTTTNLPKIRPLWKNRIFVLSIAASVLFLIGIFRFNTTTTDNPFTYKENITNSLRSGGVTNELQSLYDKEDYQTVISEGNQLLIEVEDLVLMADAHYKLANYPQAIDLLKKVTSEAKDKIKLEAYLNIATLYILNKQPDEALNYLQQIEDRLRFGGEGAERLDDLEKEIGKLLK